MIKFWQQYLDMVEILFDFRKYVRDGNWNLHIAALERMLKSYCTWASQINLSQNHPNIFKEFQKYNFSFRRVPGKFNRIHSDQVIEQTVSRDQKGISEIIRFSTTKGTVQCG